MKRLSFLFGTFLFVPSIYGARLFDDALTEYMQVDSAIQTGPTWTVSAWSNTDQFDLDVTVFWMGDKDVSDDFYQLSMEGDEPGDPIEVRLNTPTTNPAARTTTGYSTGTWHHLCFVDAGASEHTVYIDGGSKETKTNTLTFTGHDRMAIGMARDTTPTAPFSGDIAHVALWNVALTDQEVAILAAGVSPLRVRRDALVAYWPVGGQSPEPDIVGGANMTITGTPDQSEEPPIPNSVVAPG